MIIELHDIYTYALPATIFLFGSAVGLLVCAAAALWPWSTTPSGRRRPAGHRAGLPRLPAPSIVQSQDYAARSPIIETHHQAGDPARAGA